MAGADAMGLGRVGNRLAFAEGGFLSLLLAPGADDFHDRTTFSENVIIYSVFQPIGDARTIRRRTYFSISFEIHHTTPGGGSSCVNVWRVSAAPTSSWNLACVEVEGNDADGHAEGLGPALDAHHVAFAVDVQRPARVRVLEREPESDNLARFGRPERSVAEREEHPQDADVAGPPSRVIDLDRNGEAMPQ